MKLILVFLMVFLFFSYPSEARQLKIAIVDTGMDLKDPRFNGILCPSGHKNFTDEPWEKSLPHGVHVAGLIKQHAKKSNYCLIIIKVFSKVSTGKQDAIRTAQGLYYAGFLDVDAVNYSGGGSVFYEPEYTVIKDNANVTFIVAAGNEGKDLNVIGNNYYPASYSRYLNNVVVVGNLGQDGIRHTTSNYGDIVKFWQVGTNLISFGPNGTLLRMSGTSMACAVQTGKYIYEHSH